MEQCSAISFMRHGHPYHLYVYDHVDGIPDGVVIKDANEILNRDRIFKYSGIDSYAGFANVFRYKLLFERGHYWADTDMICLRPVRIDGEHVFARQRLPLLRLRRPCLNGCMMRAPEGSPVMKACYEASIAKDPKALQWGEIGPRLLTAVVSRQGYDRFCAAPSAFCPIDFWKWRDIICPHAWVRARNRFRMRNSFAVHLWNEMWRRAGVSKDARFPAPCLYEMIKARYMNCDLA